MTLLWPNHAPQQPRRERRGCSRCLPFVRSLNLCREAARMITRLILMASVLSGCASAPAKRTVDEVRAEKVARLYAVQSLGLSKAQVARMRADIGAFGLEDSGRVMTIQ